MKRYIIWMLYLPVVLALLHLPTLSPLARASSYMQPQPTSQPQPPLQPGGFIQVEGSQLTRLGQPVTIKGINYYPSGRPWREMWQSWDGTQAERELTLAHQQLGINTVRILLPYDVPRDSAITRLRELAQIAGNLDMRLIVTLFDFDDSFPPAGSAEFQRQIRYLHDLIGNFHGDDRIFAWDLHNEPDHYKTWQEGGAQLALAWLSNIADEVHRLAPNHLVTVGMGQYDNLWQPGPDGRRVVDYSDVISVHIYNAPDAQRQLYELRQHTSKPILLGEFGWPSGPRCIVREYSEDTQTWFYRTTLEGAQRQVAGIIAWTLRDYHAGPTMRWDTREEYYGLYRPDDSLKPAAQLLAAYSAPALPSLTKTQFPITREPPNNPGGPFSPKTIEGSPYHVKGWFRVAWELFGGRGSFGLPLGEAYIRPSDGIVVQYFEAAVLEFHDDRADIAYDRVNKEARAKRLIHALNLGQRYSTEHPLPNPAGSPNGSQDADISYSVQGEFKSFYEGVQGAWRLGDPISNELVEEINGVPTRVQYFERGRLEANPTSGVIQMGQLGSWSYSRDCQ